MMPKPITNAHTEVTNGAMTPRSERVTTSITTMETRKAIANNRPISPFR